jgi:hypothetical protein
MGGFTTTVTFETVPHYTCHKKVGALEISGVDGFALTFTNGNSATISRDIFSRYTPVPGDFLVVYEDGYMSFSPRKAFLDGYKPTDDRTFADIKKELKS